MHAYLPGQQQRWDCWDHWRGVGGMARLYSQVAHGNGNRGRKGGGSAPTPCRGPAACAARRVAAESKKETHLRRGAATDRGSSMHMLLHLHQCSSAPPRPHTVRPEHVLRLDSRALSGVISFVQSILPLWPGLRAATLRCGIPAIARACASMSLRVAAACICANASVSAAPLCATRPRSTRAMSGEKKLSFRSRGRSVSHSGPDCASGHTDTRIEGRGRTVCAREKRRGPV